MTTITGPAINVFRLRTLISALKLEMLGMKRRGKSAYAILKDELGISGSRQKVYDQAMKIYEEQREAL